MNGEDDVSLRPGLRTHFGMGISVTQPGGLNSVINGLSKAQSQLGLNVSVNDSIHGRALEKHAVLPLDGSLGNISRTPRDSYSVNHFHFAFTAAQVGLFHPALYKSSDIDIFHFHGPWKLESQISGQTGLRLAMKSVIERFVYGRFEYFWTASTAFSQLLSKEFGISSANIANTGLGVDTEFFTRPEGFIPAPETKFTLGTVRRLEKRMGLENLIEAMVQIPDALLRIVGTGEISEQLKSLSQDLGVADRVTFLGFLPTQDLPLFYSALDLCIIPSVALEGFSVTALEAFACGTPVLASNLDGLAESVGGLSKSLLFTPNSVEAIVKSIQIFREKKSISTRECRDYAEKFSWLSKTIALEDWLSEKVTK